MSNGWECVMSNGWECVMSNGWEGLVLHCCASRLACRMSCCMLHFVCCVVLCFAPQTLVLPLAAAQGTSLVYTQEVEEPSKNLSCERHFAMIKYA